MNIPKISWLLCTHVYSEKLIRAIDSCLDQDFKDFELVVVINGEFTNKIFNQLSLRYSSYEKVRLIKSNLYGLTNNLNLGLYYCNAELVARLDSDDVSMNNRLSIQYQFMMRNPEVTVLGTAFKYIDQNNELSKTVIMPTTDKEIRRSLYTSNPICHPSVMFRRSIILQYGGYLGDNYSQDYDLWSRLTISDAITFANLPIPLVHYSTMGDGDARQSVKSYSSAAATMIKMFFRTLRFKWLLGFIIISLKIVMLYFKKIFFDIREPK
jgi:glycosyltransferase involved in cell wall biosynthesis